MPCFYRRRKDDDPAFVNREIDIEFSRWNDQANRVNAQYAVQPYERAGHLHAFRAPRMAPSTHAFDWRPDSVHFQSLAGILVEPVVPDDVIDGWTFAGAVPPPGAEQVRINLWLFHGVPPADGRPLEMIVADFSFTPATLGLPSGRLE